MSNRAAEYRRFLNTDFWKKLSMACREKHNFKCQRCRKRANCEAHHRFYRKDWFETQLEDLECLCRRCHEKEHGIRSYRFGFMPYREDERFNAFMHRIHHLNIRVSKGERLRERDVSFLVHALRTYPSVPGDSCMEFKVNHTMKLAELMKDANGRTESEMKLERNRSRLVGESKTLKQIVKINHDAANWKIGFASFVKAEIPF